MGPEVNRVLKETAKTIKSLPKLAWVAAVIVPGGFIAIGIYTAVKVYTGSPNDRSKNRRR